MGKKRAYLIVGDKTIDELISMALSLQKMLMEGTTNRIEEVQAVNVVLKDRERQMQTA